MEAVNRLEAFLNYISDKIKSNTVKMQVSFQNANETPATPYVETISESDLSINEFQLNAFNEFMIAQEKENQQKELNNKVRDSWKAFPFPQSRMSRISADNKMLHGH